jgi:hypothetical protein
MHPQIIGRPGRLKMLDRLIGWMQGHAGVQFVTGADMAAQVRGE